MPVGPVAAFLVASVAVNPQVFLLTVGTLGWRMAVGQAVVVFAAAVIVGMLASSSCKQKLDDALNGRDDGHSHVGWHDRHAEHSRTWSAFLQTSLGIAEHVLLYFILGILIANAVAMLMGGDLFAALMGSNRWFAIPLAGLLSIPMYVCGGAMIPFLAVGGKMGMSQGAILAFLIVGPSTRIAPLVGMSSIFTKRALMLYVLIVVCLAMAGGFAYDSLFPVRMQIE
jgi:hypothetical protein